MTTTIRYLAILAIVLFSVPAFGQDESDQLQVVSVTPSGDEVPITRGEIIIEFNKKMVAFGQTDKDLSTVPVEIKPELQCTWRWTGLSQLTCAHSDRLLYTTSYVISIGISLEALDGSRLESQREFSFRTASLGAYGRTSFWRSPTRPVYKLTFSQPMSLGTIVQNVQIRDLTSSELQEIKVVHFAGLSRIHRLVSPHYRQNKEGVWTRVSETERAAQLQSLEDGGIDRASYAKEKPEFATRTWFVEPLSSLKPNTPYDLEVASNVTSVFATEPTTLPMHISRFEVYPAFEFLGLECQDNNGTFLQKLLRSTASSSGRLEGCNPDMGITLLFSSPVAAYDAKYRSTISPKPEGDRNHARARFFTIRTGALVDIPDFESQGTSSTFATDDDLNKVKIGYELKGNSTYEMRVGFAPLTDVFGRRLRQPTTIKFHTGHLKPRLDYEMRSLVFAPESDVSVPVEAANLKELRVRMATETFPRRRWSARTHRQRLSLPADRIATTQLDFHDWVPEGTRRFAASIEPIAGREFGENPETSCIYGQIAHYDVQARIGHASSIVWVTDLQTGRVVPNASVLLLQSKDFDSSILVGANTNKQGVASFPGSSLFSAVVHMKTFQTPAGPFKDTDCQIPFHSGHALWIDGPDGSSVLPLDRSFSNSGGYSNSQQDTHLSVWGHTAQGMYRPGQTVQYKIYVREQTDKGLRIGEDRRYRLVVTKGYGDLVYHENGIELNEFGSFHGEFPVTKPTFGNEGTLRFLVMIDNGESFSSIWDAEDNSLNYSEVEYWKAFEVKVLDFDPATIRVESSLDKKQYQLEDTLVVSATADLISSGPFSNAPIAIQSFLNSERFVSEHPETKDFNFVSASNLLHEWKLEDFQTGSSATDSEGGFSASLKLDVEDIHYGSLTVSLGVQEDSGNVIWENMPATYRSAERFVGVRQREKHARVGETLTIDTVVVDPSGAPQNDLPVTVKVIRIDSRYTQRGRQGTIVHTCELAADQTPKACAMTPSRTGSLRAVATIHLPDGRTQKAVESVYVQGPVQEVEREEHDYFRIQNVRFLQDRQFNAGEYASLVVEHSVPGSMALVTVERLGILDHWVTELEGTHDVIDIPIRPAYAPIVRATVTVTTANSVNKPRTFVAASNQQRFPNSWTRHVKLRVADPERQLALQITTDKEVYKPGDKVKVSVAVNESSLGANLPAAELAVAVLDQGVLEVSAEGIRHFDPVRGLLEKMDIDVGSYWLLQDPITVVGSWMARDEFDTPAPRSNEDLTSLWMPNLETGKDGTASFEFEIGDRLTEWQIIVVAASPTEHFGFGKKSIRTNLGIEIRPVLPNQVTDTDAFDASFSVLNRTESKREVEVEIEAEGDVRPYKYSQSIVLDPFERKLVDARIHAKLANDRKPSVGSIRLLATAASEDLSDALVQVVPVYPNKQHFVSSIYGTSTHVKVAEPIEFPSDISDGTGSLEIQVTPSLVNAVEGHVAQVRDYPYQCWEQRLSSAIVAAQYFRLSERLNVDWKDASQYIQDVLQSAIEYQSASSGGFGYWSGQVIHADLYLSAYTALAFRWLSDAGYQVPEDVLEDLLDYLEDYTVYRLPNYLSQDNSAAASVKLMLTNALVQHGRGDLNLVEKLYEERSKPNLFSIAQTLEATLALDTTSELIEPLTTRLTNGIGVTGDRALVHHGTARGRNFTLSSKLKTTCSTISAFVRASNLGRELVPQEKLAELVRGVLFEWNQQNWRANTHESSFCLTAVLAYAESMENVAEDFMVDVKLVVDDSLEGLQSEKPAKGTAGESYFAYSTPLRPHHVGTPAELQLSQSGNSRFYYKATLQYEPTTVQTDRENYGIDIRRTYWVQRDDQWVELSDSHVLKRGDVVHVGLYLDIRDQRDFVIVDDPVPGFLQPINARLAKTNVHEMQASSFQSSTLAANVLLASAFGGSQQTSDSYSALVPADIEGDWRVLGSSRWGFYDRELSNESVRFASDFLPSGRYRLHWTGRVISKGEFLARPAHAEAMYSPEIYGNSAPRRISTDAD